MQYAHIGEAIIHLQINTLQCAVSADVLPMSNLIIAKNAHFRKRLQ